jgi:hypothetical protein
MANSRNRLYLLLIISCLAGYIWLISASFSAGKAEAEIGVCIFKHVTNIPCPSCGSTRSLLSLLKGNIFEAFYWNPIGIILAFLLVIIPVWILLDFLKRKNSLFLCYKKAEVFLRKREVAIPAILLVASNWVWNIFKGL